MLNRAFHSLKSVYCTFRPAKEHPMSAPLFIQTAFDLFQPCQLLCHSIRVFHPAVPNG